VPSPAQLTGSITPTSSIDIFSVTVKGQNNNWVRVFVTADGNGSLGAASHRKTYEIYDVPGFALGANCTVNSLNLPYILTISEGGSMLYKFVNLIIWPSKFSTCCQSKMYSEVAVSQIEAEPI